MASEKKAPDKVKEVGKKQLETKDTIAEASKFNWKPWTIGFGSLVILGISLYVIFVKYEVFSVDSISSVDSINANNMQIIESLGDENDVEEVLDVDRDLQSEERKTFEVGEYDVSLLLPEEYNVSEEKPHTKSIVTFDVERDFTIYPEDYPNQDSPTTMAAIVDLSAEPIKMSYEEFPALNRDEDFLTIEIDGTEYDVEYYYLGDGAFGSGSFIGNYLIELESDLYVSIYTSSGFGSYTYCMEDCANGAGGADECVEKDDCTEYKDYKYEYETSEETLELAKDVVQSLEWGLASDTEVVTSENQEFQFTIESTSGAASVDYISIMAPDSGKVVLTNDNSPWEQTQTYKGVDGFFLNFQSIPHMALPATVTGYVELESEYFDELYRVSFEGEDTYFYTTDLQLDDSKCGIPNADVVAPCSPYTPSIILEGVGAVQVSYSSSSDFELADSIVESLYFYKDSELK